MLPVGAVIIRGPVPYLDRPILNNRSDNIFVRHGDTALWDRLGRNAIGPISMWYNVMRGDLTPS